MRAIGFANKLGRSSLNVVIVKNYKNPYSCCFSNAFCSFRSHNTACNLCFALLKFGSISKASRKHISAEEYLPRL